MVSQTFNTLSYFFIIHKLSPKLSITGTAVLVFQLCLKIVQSQLQLLSAAKATFSHYIKMSFTSPLCQHSTYSASIVELKPCAVYSPTQKGREKSIILWNYRTIPCTMCFSFMTTLQAQSNCINQCSREILIRHTWDILVLFIIIQRKKMLKVCGALDSVWKKEFRMYRSTNCYYHFLTLLSITQASKHT